MRNPVYGGNGRHEIGKDALPAREDQVGRDAQRPAFVAFVDQGEQDLGLLCAMGLLSIPPQPQRDHPQQQLRPPGPAQLPPPHVSQHPVNPAEDPVILFPQLPPLRHQRRRRAEGVFLVGLRIQRDYPSLGHPGPAAGRPRTRSQSCPPEHHSAYPRLQPHQCHRPELQPSLGATAKWVSNSNCRSRSVTKSLNPGVLRLQRRYTAGQELRLATPAPIRETLSASRRSTRAHSTRRETRQMSQQLARVR